MPEMRTCRDCGKTLANRRALRCQPCFHAQKSREYKPREPRKCLDCEAFVCNHYALRCLVCSAAYRKANPKPGNLRDCPQCGGTYRRMCHGVCTGCYQKNRYRQKKGEPEFDRVRLEATKRWRAQRKDCPKHRDKCASQRRKRTYNLSAEDHSKMLSEQGGKCAICEKDTALVVDHCHTSGKVRALLCTKCNLCLGYLEKNRPLYEGKLQDYLERFASLRRE